MTKHNFLLEIGIEDMPARSVRPTTEQLKTKLAAFLNEQWLSYDHIKVFGTPRRFAALVSGLAEMQETRTKIHRGPAKRIAVDENGEWTKAAKGFARGKNVSLADLYFDEEKGEPYLFAKEEQGGHTAAEILPLVKRVIKEIDFVAAMSWSDHLYRYLRPVHWYVALLDDEVIPFELMDAVSGRATRGHRFLAPGKVELTNAKDYEKTLEKAAVIADQDKRKQMITEQIKSLEQEYGWHVDLPVDLLEEVTQLVEYPTAFVGEYDKKYLSLPDPVLITTMAEHQRYFSVKGENGDLEAYFIGVRNGDDRALEQVIHGNEKVLVARLDDAQFFVAEDQKHSIDDFAAKLSKVTFHEKIGTMADKMAETQKIARALYDHWAVEDLFAAELHTDFLKQIARAGEIYKFDLETQIVNEFSELQGIMGEIYAREAGEDPMVQYAIREHYMPVFAQGDLPESPLGVLYAVADKLQAIIRFFEIGKIPSGSNDPFALRRQMTGIVQILRAYDLPFDWDSWLPEMIALICSDFSYDEVKALTGHIYDFMLQRLRFQWQQAGLSADLIQAVLASNDTDINDKYAAVKTLLNVQDQDDFKSNIEAWNRILNLIPKMKEMKINPKACQEELLQTDSERQLYDLVMSLDLGESSADRYYSLSGLADAIDEFFEENMIFTDDEKLRNNRLALLAKIAEEVLELADTKQIKTKGR